MKFRHLAPIICGALFHTHPAWAVELPHFCAEKALARDDTTAIADLRRQVEAKSETDPEAAVGLMCMAIPRVELEMGPESAELAWWVGSLTMPMIAYMNQFAEALPLLAFAQPILEKTYGPDAEQLADIHVAYAWIYYRQGKLADAAQAWRRGLAIRERFPGARKIELQKVLVGLALVELSQGELAAARTSLQRAHDILAENGELVSEAAAAVENVFTNLAFREENFAEAKVHAEAQIRIENQLQGGIGQLVPAYVLLGQILEKLDDFAASEAASREAIRLSEAEHGPLQRHHFTALTQLALLLSARGRPHEALEMAQRAVQVGETTLGHDAPRLVKALQAQADAYRSLGDLGQAWHTYERISAIVEKNRADIERPVLVSYYRGLSGVQLDLGNLEDATTALHAGLDAASAEPSLALQRAYLTATLAQLSTREHDLNSRTLLEQARELFESRLPASHPAILRVVSELCSLEIAAAAPAANCQEAKRRIERGNDIEPELRAAVYRNLSELSQSQGKLDSASQLAIQAVAAAEGLGTPEPLWKAYFRAADVLQARGQSKLAIYFGKRSLAQIQRQRSQFSGADERFDRGFLQDKSTVYRSVADWLMQSGRIDEALEALQLLKAQEFAEFVARSAAETSTRVGPELNESERLLEQRYAATLHPDRAAGQEIDRLSRLQDKDRITAGEREKLGELGRAQRQHEVSTAQQIGRFVARNGASRGPMADVARSEVSSILTPRVAQTLHNLPPDSAIGVYLLTDRALRILMVTPHAQTEVAIPVDAERLQLDIGQFLEQIVQRADVSVTSRKLYDAVARPLDAAARRENVKHLFLWLDGPMRYIPFGALLGADGYLGERYAIQIMAQGDVAVGPMPLVTVGASSPTVRGFGLTQAVAGFPSLPAMAEELCYVVRGPVTGLAAPSRACAQPIATRSGLSGEGYADTQFTAVRLKDELQAPHSFSVLHLGTHFSLRPGNMNRSFIVLGDGSRLMLDSLSAFDFSGLDLVTLSACQTAMGGGRTQDGREIEGLNAIVQQRGAKRVIASLWQVEDVSTAELMRAFYSHLAQSADDFPLALQEAQRAVRQIEINGQYPYAHPYYWAGFVLSGRGP